MTKTPDEQENGEPENDEPKNAGSASKDKTAWDAIVADLSGQVDLGPQFTPDPTPPEYDYIDAYFDEGYEPPEPPRITAPPDAIARFAWAGVIGGPVLAISGYVLGFGDMVGAAGVIAAIAGFGLLIFRREHHVPPGEDHGDGAVV
ncbi:MAG: hypothetical protein NWR45_01380 [Candidatus Nanopelagicales bacterium]|nr:hypothetical protein [Candidatus Nanopelagicales bacterium]